MTTISVAYFISPCASFAKIGRTANAGVAAFKNAATLSAPNLFSFSLSLCLS